MGNPKVSPRVKTPASLAAIVILAVLAIWLALVVFTASRHEFWRDEVRALTLVRAADSPVHLYELLRDDGHPMLWYLLLFAGTSVADTPLVLPITSILIALAAVALFMFFAPFPLWFRCAFVFSAFPLFEYSVMARNYGISMLLFVLVAMAYPARAAHPYRLAVALALLANTNVHSTMLACLFAAAWAWDIAATQKKWLAPAEMSRYLPLAIVAAGVVMSCLVAMPRENNILTPVRHADGIAGMASALGGAVLRPDLTFADLLPSWLRPKPAVLLLYGAILGLVMRPNLLLAALAAQVAFGVFFRVVYPGWYRHQGLYLLFLVFLYWVFVESASSRAWSGIRLRAQGASTKPKGEVGAMAGRWAFRGGFYVSVLALVLVQLARAPGMVWSDIDGTRSASRALGEFLRSSSAYRDAVIVPEPDFAIEALPYYATNEIYLPREHRFGRTVSWTSASKARLTLGNLLRAARSVKEESGRPVLIVLAPFNLDGAGEQDYLYRKAFSWSAAEVEEFRTATTHLIDFEASVGDEDYRVYLLQ